MPVQSDGSFERLRSRGDGGSAGLRAAQGRKPSSWSHTREITSRTKGATIDRRNARASCTDRRSFWHRYHALANNGGTEAVNGLIELARRVARGFRDPDNYRLRMLLIGGGLRL